MQKLPATVFRVKVIRSDVSWVKVYRAKVYSAKVFRAKVSRIMRLQDG